MTQFSLNNCKYGVFKVSSLFDVKGTKTTPLEVLRSKSETKVEFPYVTTKSDFMGVDGFFNCFTEEGNVIVVDSATNGHIHYQISNFSASDHVEKLVPKFKMNFYIAQFFVSSLKYATKNKFNYGYKFNQLRIKNQKFMLPIDEEGNPNFKFMEKYIKNKYLNLLNKYKEYIENKLEKLHYKQIKELDEVEWDTFILSNLGEINSGKDISKTERIDGNIPYISATSQNNGITDYVNNENDTLERNCISINRTGSVGYSFYHPYQALFSNNCRKLILKNKNKYISLFIVNQIKHQKEKYSYGYIMGTNRLKKNKKLLYQ